ncbi:alanine--tRNA ligase [Lewinella cohaerens]|uniref:alanine--tRNA ligase n=1 Tax=Lewinella cohaerens TaxID=70995 RepID=UPI00037340A7|nr:alanine--tRNA ligase [Lewinella cohaerens]
MKANEIRQAFLDFFAEKQHKIVPSAPIVLRNDPTLMFTNAGMNQFKDYFLGNQTPAASRIADTQKCMRVSGKHNDLEDVGLDGTHHTMFEMLGNWSFGDYFKDEAIAWSWEFLTDRMGIPADRLYATVFGGDTNEKLASDEEAREFWKRHLPTDRILDGDKKDNFWEMGDTGPCGPCTEIHVDTRSDEERAKVDGATLVNVDDSGVVEIWNNVFIQFNRKADSSLESLPAKHVDTGMGFERLCMVLQNKTATYDTDIFTPLISFLEKETGHKYGYNYGPKAKADMAMRVISDHIRAVSFTIADGQLPDNGGAGYVIRRILRRAVRYYYSFLDVKQPLLHKLVPILVKEMGASFPELQAQEEQIAKIIESEEKTFLNTLENGLKRFASLETTGGQISGQDAFELYDTFGFPIDLTRLMAREQGLTIDEAGFESALQVQKKRSRKDAEKEVGDWQTVNDGEVSFVGYDQLEVENTEVLKYRTVVVKKKNQFQVVLATTPFYAESGGQAGDRGELIVDGQSLKVIDTQKENDLIIHIVNRLPDNLESKVLARVNPERRAATSQNHTATHLMHAALHQIVGEHALQKGQNVDNNRLRFDFSHYQKVTDEELASIEKMVNEKIRQNIALDERRDVPIAEAKELGAMMLFGEKYGDAVRVITFEEGFSQELCGGTHVPATGEIGLFKIVKEDSVAAGIRRIEAVTGAGAEAYINEQLQLLSEVSNLLKSNDLVKGITSLQEENKTLKREVEKLVTAQASNLKGDLKQKFEDRGGVNFLAARIPLSDAGAVKTLAFQLEKEVENAFVLLASENEGKPLLTLIINQELATAKDLNAGKIIRELAREIKGGGGGQAHFATAGGKDAEGLDRAVAKVGEMV